MVVAKGRRARVWSGGMGDIYYSVNNEKTNETSFKKEKKTVLILIFEESLGHLYNPNVRGSTVHPHFWHYPFGGVPKANLRVRRNFLEGIRTYKTLLHSWQCSVIGKASRWTSKEMHRPESRRGPHLELPLSSVESGTVFTPLGYTVWHCLWGISNQGCSPETLVSRDFIGTWSQAAWVVYI